MLPAYPFLLLLSLSLPPTGPRLRLELGVAPDGGATPQWLAMIRKRVSDPEYQAIAPLRKPLSPAERAWVTLIEGRLQSWEREIPPLAELFDPVAAPPVARIVLGNRGGSDAFTHDPTTIGFDLASLQEAYGDATSPENAERMDRLFRHEYLHLLQKAWLVVHPYPAETPLRMALFDIWAEGLGNYYSLSQPWRMQGDTVPERARRALAELEPRLVARMAALACARPEQAAGLTADLSSGRFDRKWGAVSAALWLERENHDTAGALRRLILAGPDGIWDLGARRLPPPLAAVLAEARVAAARCVSAP